MLHDLVPIAFGCLWTVVCIWLGAWLMKRKEASLDSKLGNPIAHFFSRAKSEEHYDQTEPEPPTEVRTRNKL